MRRVILLAIAMLLAAAAFGHKGTEQYIPIGQSPGVSGKYSTIGEIRGMDDTSHVMTVVNDRGTYRVRMSDKTKIYVDRSKAKRPSRVGTYADCTAGHRVEIKYRNNDPNEPAEWIKVE